MLLLGQILALSVFPFAFLWVYFMHTRGHEITPELNRWSNFFKLPNWFYLAPVGIGFWVIGLIIVSYAKG